MRRSKTLTVVTTSLLMGFSSFPVSAHLSVLSVSYYADRTEGKRMANGSLFSQNSNSVASNQFKNRY